MYRAESISKSYGSTSALAQVTLEFRQGEIHALLGMNGAGKSTLVKILCGIEAPDEGRILLNGEVVSPSSRYDAHQLGIALVPQHSTLFPHLDLAANIFAGEELTSGPIVRVRRERELAQAALDRVGLPRSTKTMAGALSVGESQLVEIARAILKRPRVLFLDEPTAALSRPDRVRLFDLLNQIVADGTAVVLVTHFLDEALHHSHRISVLRDRGVALGEAPREGLNLEKVIAEMTGPGRQFSTVVRQGAVTETRDVSGSGPLELRGVSGKELTDVSLKASPGEIVGLAGLLGSGVEELLDIVVGSTRPSGGSLIYPDGTRPRSVRAAVRSGLAYVPSDRGARALMGRASLFANASLVRLGALVAPSIRPLALPKERAFAEVALDTLQTKYESSAQPAWSLSGGNQQKLVFAKWIVSRSTVFVLDDPTRAVDVHAKAEMHAILENLRSEGKVIFLASTDLEELAGLCDRVLVLARGRLAGELRRAEGLSVERVIEIMSA